MEGKIKIKEGVHYAYEDDGTFVCLNCRRVFQSQYSPKEFQVKKYGTKQLLALWAWYNFERHLMSCWKKSTTPVEQKSGGEEEVMK